MTEVNPQLISDLARLAARYPPEDWLAVLELLEDDNRRLKLSSLLRELAATSRARRRDQESLVGRRPGRASRVRLALKQIRLSDAHKADLLEDVWLRLRKRELLPDMRTIRAFADVAGLKGLAANKREQAVTELMEQLVSMPSDEWDRIMQETVVSERKLGDEYEQWVRLILGRRLEGNRGGRPSGGL